MIESLISGSKKQYNNEKELNEDFFPLFQFINNSVFVGREFKRTKPVQISKNYAFKKYIPDSLYNTRYIVLYTTQELFLAIKTDDYLKSKEYIIVEKRYIEDGCYEFFGKTYNEYHNPLKVYIEIAMQTLSISNKNKEIEKRHK